METNENSLLLKMSNDGPVEAPQAPFSNATEAMDTTPVEKDIVMNDEGIKKQVEPEPVENNEHVNQDGLDHEVVNNKEEMNCDEPAQIDSTSASPVKTALNNSDAHNENNMSEAVSTSEVVTSATETAEPHVVQPEEREAMEQDVKQEAEEQTDQPDSTPTPAEVVPNEVHQSDDETQVEDVTHEVQENKVEESSAEPVIEEPQEVEPQEADGETDQQLKSQEEETKQQVEISDVTEKEDQVKEVKKSDEELLLDHISSAYQYLDDFMKTKDEVKIKDCMDLLSEIKTLTVKTVDALKVFTSEEPKEERGSKKGKRPKSNAKVNKSTSRTTKHDISNESDSPDPLEEVNLKDIKGLAVFAKWRYSGWFYPGVVRDLSLSDLKSGNQNLTVTFYDGLERDMKSIHIFPAQLIPPSSILFDLDDECDMTVASIENEDNWIKYVFTSSGDSEPVTKDFDKMAIKGAHMKTIRQMVDNQAANMSADTIVTGRRARGKSSMFNDDYVSSSSPRSTEKRKSKVEDSKSTTPTVAPAKRKSSSKEDESGDSTPRSASKRRQVNGTKSTPRRAARK